MRRFLMPGWPSKNLVLQQELRRRGIVGLDETQGAPDDPRLRLWRGDITRLRADAIVNAANSTLLGCMQPGHHCVDNAIHTFAGLQLRLACAAYMRSNGDGYREPTGQAMVTPVYNLPRKAVIHAVGPIVRGHSPSAADRAALASVYDHCLQAALYHGMRSIAFCSVSTGVFGYPKADAADLAIARARTFLATLPEDSPLPHLFHGVLGD